MVVQKVPVFDNVWERRQKTECNASMVFVPAAAAADSILEAVDAGVELVVCITEGIPVIDMMRVKVLMRGKKSRLIGPNCPGIITPGQCKIGIMPGYIHKPGNIGVISRSGTLTYEAVWQLTSRGYAHSTCIGIGRGPIPGLSHPACVRLFNYAPRTYALLLIGSVRGSAATRASEAGHTGGGRGSGGGPGGGRGGGAGAPGRGIRGARGRRQARSESAAGDGRASESGTRARS